MLRGLVITLAVLAAPASAECGGPSLIEWLSADDRAILEAAVAETPFSEGLIWQAVQGDKTITIAGTMHIHDPRSAPIEAALMPLLAQSELLLLEMTPVEQEKMQAALTADPTLVFLGEGQTLPDLLDPKSWDALSVAANDRNIPPQMAAKLRPWFLMLSLSMPVCALSYVNDGQLGIDMVLMEEAGRAGVPMRALEPWDTMIRMFDQGTMEEQLDFLRMGILDAATQEALFVAMLDGYFRGNVAEVWELSRLAMQFIPGISPEDADALFAATGDLLLTGRNAGWIPVIEAAAAEHDRIMVAAGAAHLTGPDGILALLQDRDWTISQVY